MTMKVPNDHPHHSVASRYRSGEGMTFSSLKCPPGLGLENNCELPFGFLWTPMAPPESSVSEEMYLPPILCVTCLAYMNLYCEIIGNAAAGETSYWLCPFCKCENVIPPQLQHQYSLTPTMEFQQPLRSEHYETIVIVMDINMPAAEALAIGKTLQNVLKDYPKNHTCHLGLIMFGKNVSIYQLGSSSGMALCDVVASHEGWNINNNNKDQPSSSPSSSYYLTTHTDTQSLLTCIAAQYGVIDTSHNNSNDDTVTTTISSSSQTTTQTSRLQLLKERKEARLRKQQKEQAIIAEENFTSDGSQKLDDGSQRTVDTTVSNSAFHAGAHHRLVSPWVTARQQMQTTAPPWRCTGEAIQCAIDLIMTNEESLIVHGGNSNDNNNSNASNNDGRNSGLQTPTRTARVLLFTNGCPNYGDGSVVENPEHYGDNETTNQTWNGNGKKMKEKAKAILYSTVDPAKLARASEYFTVISKAAAEGGIGFDVFCTGSSELGLPAYQALVEPSAGYVISHDTFVAQHLQHNVNFLLNQTHMSLAHFQPESATDPNIMNKIRARHDDNGPSILQKDEPVSFGTWMEGCTVDFRMSSFLNATHLIGPGDLQSSIDGPLPNEEHVFEFCVTLANEQSKMFKNKAMPSLDMLESSLTRIRLGRFDPLSTFSFMLRLNDFFQHDKFAFFQGIVRYTDREGKFLITRVTTHRLPVASDVGEFLEAIDEEVVPVLLGKEAVYRATFGRDVDPEHPFHAPHAGELDSLAYNSQRDLDCTIFRISAAFRLLSLAKGTRTIDLTEEGGVKAAGSSMDFAFPPELSDALRRLYHLRRGPFLSPGPLQSMDDRTEMRSYFIRFPLEDCLEMMAPSLWSSGPLDEALTRNAPSLENVPPDTLALWENRIIAADHWHILFIYSGSAAIKSDYDTIRKQLREFLLDRTVKRFPMPILHILNEKDSMSRRFTTLLAPLHSDPSEHQLAHFPALALLSIPEQQKLNDRFRFYDAESDPSFRKWFWDVASAASSSGEEGISLCE